MHVQLDDHAIDAGAQPMSHLTVTTIPCAPSSCVFAYLPHVPYHNILMVCIGWTTPARYLTLLTGQFSS